MLGFDRVCNISHLFQFLKLQFDYVITCRFDLLRVIEVADEQRHMLLLQSGTNDPELLDDGFEANEGSPLEEAVDIMEFQRYEAQDLSLQLKEL